MESYILEHVPIHIFTSPVEGSKYVAQHIAQLIQERAKQNKSCVLGLATGSTPKQVYAELVSMHKAGKLSFKNVISFNLDEYYPISKKQVQSYWHFMHQHLFDHVDIDPKNIHIPNGELKVEEIKQFANEYEATIEQAGGIDLQLLGIGHNGHIGFNEPGSALFSKTRLINLDYSTRFANSGDFSSIADVPLSAITMGLGTILKAKKIILMAWGESKASIIQQSAEGDCIGKIPASLLQNHGDTSFVIDELAAKELTSVKSPWLYKDVEWTPKLLKRAVIQLSLKLNKPILLLTNEDYSDQGLGSLIVEYGSAQQANLKVYYMLRDSITGWPAGKKYGEISNHPERSNPLPKRVMIFSPHPDDDIISMGGTFIRLQDQGNEVHLAYQTSGNIAVTDEFVTRFLDFAAGYQEMFSKEGIDARKRYQAAFEFVKNKKQGDPDTPELRAIKGLIRRCEAKAVCKVVGLKEEQIHFMNLPFYETGKIQKNPIGEEDIKLTMELLRKVKPHQVFAAGDLADPHGTHRVCFDAIFIALQRIKEAGDEWIKDCWLWLYKGAWQEWDIAEIEMAVPMSPDQIKQKRDYIFIHQSQKDNVPFQGSDNREFWQRAEERNQNTARLYAQLGMTQYAAMEAFVRWHF